MALELAMIGGAVGALGLAVTLFGYFGKNKQDKNRKTYIGIGIAIFVLAMAGIVTDQKVSTFTAGLGSGAVTTEEADAMGRNPVPIDTLQIKLKEKGTNSWSTVNGIFEIYPANQDPKDSQSAYLKQIQIVDGNVSISSPGLQTDTDYRVIFTNGTGDGYYAIDFGVMAFPSSDYNDNTGNLLWVPSQEAKRIATLSDPLNEGQDCTVTGTTTTEINGQNNTNITHSSNEIGCLTNTCTNGCTLVYDESQADGEVYFDIDIEATGGYKYLEDVVLCFDYESGAEPEGDEIDKISTSVQSGNNFGLDSDLANYFTNEECVAVASEIEGGASSEIRLTMTYDETALDTSDDFKITIDDLGELNGKDVGLDKGVTAQSIDFDAQA